MHNVDLSHVNALEVYCSARYDPGWRRLLLFPRTRRVTLDNYLTLILEALPLPQLLQTPESPLSASFQTINPPGDISTSIKQKKRGKGCGLMYVS